MLLLEKYFQNCQACFGCYKCEWVDLVEINVVVIEVKYITGGWPLE